MKQLLASWDRKTKMARLRTQQEGGGSQRAEFAQRLAAELIYCEQAEVALEEQAWHQARGNAISGYEKFRISFQARQAVLNAFKPDAEIAGVIIKRGGRGRCLCYIIQHLR